MPGIVPPAVEVRVTMVDSVTFMVDSRARLGDTGENTFHFIWVEYKLKRPKLIDFVPYIIVAMRRLKRAIPMHKSKRLNAELHAVHGIQNPPPPNLEFSQFLKSINKKRNQTYPSSKSIITQHSNSTLIRYKVGNAVGITQGPVPQPAA